MKKLTIAAILAAVFSAQSYASDIQTTEITTKITEYVERTSTTTLQPVAVHTGRTITVKDHYDVYQPKVVYEKVGTYTVTKDCEQ